MIYGSFAISGVNRKMEDAINRFNQSHTDIQIEIRDYWGESRDQARQGREQFLTELVSGSIPDIIDLGMSSGLSDSPDYIAMLPYYQMALRGYLEDLRPYIENDPELGRERLFQAPLTAAEVNGGLYMAFGSVGIDTLVGPKSLVGDRTSWTLAELMGAFAAMPEDSTVMEYTMNRSNVLQKLFSMNLENYVDWETGECRFDCEDFRSALEFIKSFPEEVNWSSSQEVSSKCIWYMQNGRQMLLSCTLSLNSVQIYDAFFGEEVAFIGYPVEDGSTGSAFRPSGSTLAMSSACRNKEAAWEVIRQVFLPQYTRMEDAATNYAHSIPINLSDYNFFMETMTHLPPDTEKLFYGGQEFLLHTVTKQERERFESFIARIEKLGLYDDALMDIVMDAAGPYFAGDKTLDETVDLVQRRAALYVNENR